MEEHGKLNFILSILKGIFISILFTIIILCIFSGLLVYTDLSESYIQPVIIVTTGISILLGSMIASKNQRKNGWLNGAIIGGIYILSIYILSSIMNNCNFSLNIQSLIMILIGILGGCIGGIIGINIK